MLACQRQRSIELSRTQRTVKRSWFLVHWSISLVHYTNDFDFLSTDQTLMYIIRMILHSNTCAKELDAIIGMSRKALKYSLSAQPTCHEGVEVSSFCSTYMSLQALKFSISAQPNISRQALKYSLLLLKLYYICTLFLIWWYMQNGWPRLRRIQQQRRAIRVAPFCQRRRTQHPRRPTRVEKLGQRCVHVATQTLNY